MGNTQQEEEQCHTAPWLVFPNSTFAFRSFYYTAIYVITKQIFLSLLLLLLESYLFSKGKETEGMGKRLK